MELGKLRDGWGPERAREVRKCKLSWWHWPVTPATWELRQEEPIVATHLKTNPNNSKTLSQNEESKYTDKGAGEETDIAQSY